MATALYVVKKFFPKVKRVVDATKNATIEVTANDAAKSDLKNHKSCAMAVACKRKFHLDGVIISRSTSYLVKGTIARRFKVPESVSREVVSFDRGSGFSPGTYELQRVPPSSRFGIRPGRTAKNRKNSSDTPKRFRHITDKVRAVLGGEGLRRNHASY